MPVIFTKPPSGIAPIPYSVSPRLTDHSFGGKKRKKRSTRMPTALAATKWPNTCRMISAAKPANASAQLISAASTGAGLGFVLSDSASRCGPDPRDKLAGQRPRSCVALEQLLEVSERLRVGRLEHAHDQLGDRREPDRALEK